MQTSCHRRSHMRAVFVVHCWDSAFPIYDVLMNMTCQPLSLDFAEELDRWTKKKGSFAHCNLLFSWI